MSKKMLFIINPRSGKTKPATPLLEAAAHFSDSGWLLKVCMTEGHGHATQLAAQYGADFDAVVCAGGDGTLNETISGLMTLPQRPPIGYIPYGSTNDFAASLHLPSQPLEAAKLIAAGAPKPLDIGLHNDRHFAYVASFGAFTRSSYSAPQSAKNLLGHFAYILEGVKDLDSLRPYRCTVETDTELFSGEFIFGGVCNSTSLAGLVKLDPARVKMDDGKLELLLLRMPKSPADLQNLILALTKMQYDAPSVIFRHVEQLRLTTDDDIPWSLDGEYAPSQRVVEIRSLPHAIELLT